MPILVDPENYRKYVAEFLAEVEGDQNCAFSSQLNYYCYSA